MKKSELKSIIKECITEVLSEDNSKLHKLIGKEVTYAIKDGGPDLPQTNTATVESISDNGRVLQLSDGTRLGTHSYVGNKSKALWKRDWYVTDR